MTIENILPSCTCDEHCDSPCPRHEEVNRMQDRLIEMRELLAKAMDVLVLKGHAFATSDWERACLLAGRYGEPFLNWRSDND